jgi:hypothetical protein
MPKLESPEQKARAKNLYFSVFWLRYGIFSSINYTNQLNYNNIFRNQGHFLATEKRFSKFAPCL